MLDHAGGAGYEAATADFGTILITLVPGHEANAQAVQGFGRPAIGSSAESLAGCRILVVEDDPTIAALIEEALQELGCIVIGPVGRLSVAVQLATDEALGGAVLDVNIQGGLVYPVAERLLARGIPFMLASGQGDWMLPESLQGQPRLDKPFSMHNLREQAKLLFGSRG